MLTGSLKIFHNTQGLKNHATEVENGISFQVQAIT